MKFASTAIALMFAAFAATVPAPAQSAFFNGNHVHDWCNAEPGTQKSALCIGYVAGSLDMASDVMACPPAGVTVRQAIDIIKQALESAPQVRNEPADILLNQIFSKVWPCAQRQQQGGRGA